MSSTFSLFRRFLLTVSSVFAVAIAHAGDMQLAAGLTTTAQSTDDDRVRDELQMSADLELSLPAGPGTWSLHLEGSTGQRSSGVSSVLGEANADAGSALDAEGDGRIQISELHYSLPAAGGMLTAGLLDVTGFLDGSEVANDEGAQFLGSFFVNNPSIEFPDYTLGGAWRREPVNGPGISVVLTSSHGLADNSATYYRTFDVSDDDKGVFAAGELDWHIDTTTLRVGTWLHSGDHAPLNGTGGNENNFGVYSSIDGVIGTGKWNLRAGVANADVSNTAGFLAAAYERVLGPATLGVGLARAFASSDLGAGRDDITQAEVYARFDLSRHIHLTPSIQYIENSGFDSSGTDFDPDVTIFSLRLGYTYE